MEVIFVAIFAVVAFAIRVGPRWLRARATHALGAERRLLTKQALRLEASPIARLPEGAVARAVGKVRYQDRWAVAPMSKTPCVYCRTVISVLEYSAQSRTRVWRPIHEEVDSRSFVLRDDSGECLVDPALATHAITARRARQFGRGKAPDAILDMLERAGLSASTHGQALLVEEALLPVDATGAVAGIPRLVAVPGDNKGEHDYRSGPPTMFQFDGQQAELLIADERKLLRPKSEGRASPDEAVWGSPAIGRTDVDTPDVPVDDFEASMRSGSRRRILLAAFGVAAIAVLAIVAKRVLSRPPPLTHEHRAELEKQIAWSRHDVEFPSGCGDQCWRDALAHRREYVPGNDACARAAQLARAPFTTIEVGAELPAQSAKTTAELAQLARIEASLDRATNDQFESLLARTHIDVKQTVEVLAEVDAATSTLRTWAYDHETQRVICAGESAITGTSVPTLESSVKSLRALRPADARSR